MTLSELLLPHDERGVVRLFAIRRGQQVQAALPRLERRAGEFVAQRHHGVPDAPGAAAEVVQAWARAVTATRPPMRLGRDWMEFLIDQCEQGPLGRATLDALLRVFQEELAADLTDPDRAWLATHRVATLRFLDELSDRSTASHNAGHLARVVADGVHAVVSALDLEGPPPESVATALETVIERWVATTRRLDSDGSRFVVLELLYRELLLGFPGAPPAYWHFMWARLDQELTERLGRSPHSWTPALSALGEATEAYPVLERWPAIAESLGLTDGLSDLVAVLTVLQAGQGDAARLARSLDVAALMARAREVDFDDLGHDVAERMRRELERHQIDPLLAAIERVGRLVSGAHARVTAEDHVADATRAAAGNLAEGLQGSDAAERMEGLLRAIVGAAVRARAWTDDARARRRHFRAILALELGAGRRPEWHRYREFPPLLDRALQRHPRHAELMQLVEQVPACVTAARDTQLGWAGPRLEAVARREAGATLEALTDATQLLALGLRIVSPVEAAGWMVDAWLDTLPDASQVDPRAVRRAFRDLRAASSGAHAALDEALGAVDDLLPAVLAGCVLPGLAFRIATLASDTTFDALPDYGARLGERGHASCVRDNALTLGTLARILRQRAPDPSDALWSWWSRSVDSYIATRPEGLFEANLRGLVHGLDNLLGDAEASVASRIVVAMYRDNLGVELGGDDEVRSVLPRTYPAVGSRWTVLFGPLATPEVVQRLPASRASSLAAAAGLEALGAPLRAYLSQVRATSDPEFAAAAALRAMSDVLEAHDHDLVDEAFDRLVDGGPPASDPGVRAWWVALLGPLITACEDLALGRALGDHVGDAAKAVAVRFADTPDAQARCARDQGLVLSFLGRQLGRSPGSHVALEVGRYLTMGVAPFVDYDQATWRRVWAEVGRSLSPHLSCLGRRAWARWHAQLDGLADLLPHLRRLGGEVLHADEVVLAEQRDEDQRWRELITSLLVAVGTPSDAPVAPPHLIQRLGLVDPVLAELDPTSWPERSEALVDFLCDYLPAPLHGRIRAVCSQVHVELLNHDRLADTGHRTLSAWVAACSGHRSARMLWQGDMLCRTPGNGALRAPEDLVVAQLTGWALPDPPHLRSLLDDLTAAEAFDTVVAPREARKGLLSWFSRSAAPLTDADQDALQVWLRAMVRQEALGRPHRAPVTYRLLQRLSRPESLEALLGGLSDSVPAALGPFVERALDEVSKPELGHALAEGRLPLAAWADGDTALSEGDRHAIVRDLEALTQRWLAQCAGWVPWGVSPPVPTRATADWVGALTRHDERLRQALPSEGSRATLKSLVRESLPAAEATARGATA